MRSRWESNPRKWFCRPSPKTARARDRTTILTYPALKNKAIFVTLNITMNKALKISLIILFVLLVSFAVFFLSGKIKPKKAGILIETIPSSTVFVNSVQAGKAPYSGAFGPGEIDLKLVPDASDKPLIVFETRLLLSSGIQTVVKREFGETIDLSGGEIVSFEKTGERSPSIAVVTDPDSAQISIDGKAYGFAPYKTSQISASAHQIAVSLNGYLERTVNVKAIPGYKLTLIVKLIKDVNKLEPTPTPAATPKPEVKIEILSTPNGFLRVRSAATTDSDEVARVNPKDTFVLIEESGDSKWYKIEYQTGQFGWISGQYAKKLN